MATRRKRRIPAREVAIDRFEAIAQDPAELAAFRANIGPANAPSRIKAAVAFAGLSSVLDLGCGPAVFALTLRSRPGSPAYTGVDTSPAMVAVAPPGVNVSVQDADSLPFPDQSFDGVLIRHVLEHLPEPLPVLLEALRVCGSVLAIAFSQFPISTGSGTALITDEDMGVPRWAHDSVGLHDAIEAAGFTITEEEYYTPARPKSLAPREAWVLATRNP